MACMYTNQPSNPSNDQATDQPTKHTYRLPVTALADERVTSSTSSTLRKHNNNNNGNKQNKRSERDDVKCTKNRPKTFATQP